METLYEINIDMSLSCWKSEDTEDFDLKIASEGSLGRKFFSRNEERLPADVLQFSTVIKTKEATVFDGFRRRSSRREGGKHYKNWFSL